MPGYVYRGNKPDGVRSKHPDLELMIASPITPARVRQTLLTDSRTMQNVRNGLMCGSGTKAVLHAVKGEEIDMDCRRALRRMLRRHCGKDATLEEAIETQLTPYQREVLKLEHERPSSQS